MSEDKVNALPISSLAYLGDAIYEQVVREHIIRENRGQSASLFRAALQYVSATAQAEALDRLEPLLQTEELKLCRRARNHIPHSRPRKQDPVAYRKATALEALCAWLYLQGKSARLREVLDFCLETLQDPKMLGAQ